MQSTSGTSALLNDLNERSREVLRRVVEAYLETGDPVGSRTLSRSLSENVSAATIRNVMQDLEHLGLLDSPHVSAGRIPTELGLRLFVDAILDVGTASAADRERIEASAEVGARDVTALLDEVGRTLSGITGSASVVLTPKQDSPIRHIEFVSLSSDRALAVLVHSDGHVENRMFVPPPGLTASALREAANFLNAVAGGLTISELRKQVDRQITAQRRELDEVARQLVERGVALWDGSNGRIERLIVRGSANLIADAADRLDLERVRRLFEDLERKRDIAEALELTEGGEGVRIFIGSENKLFSLSASALVVAPYMDASRRIIGAVGVIGPKRLNYGRIVPIVNYTAQLVGRLVAERGRT